MPVELPRETSLVTRLLHQLTTTQQTSSDTTSQLAQPEVYSLLSAARAGTSLRLQRRSEHRVAACPALAHVWCWTGQLSGGPEVGALNANGKYTPAELLG